MYIVADIGGTKTRIAGSRDLSAFDEPLIIPTPAPYEEALAALVGEAQRICGTEPIVAMTVGVPGLLSKDRQCIIGSATNVPLWLGKPLARDLSERLHTRVLLENDVAYVGLGEAVYGAGKGADIVAYLTVSTGVNGARIVRGALSSDDPRPSFEYLYLDGESKHKWGDTISGRAVHEKYGKHPKELGKDNPLWEELSRSVALGVHNIILSWTPDSVVLGGSMFNEIGIPVERVALHVQEMMHAMPEVPPILHSSLGDLGGLWGGIAHLKRMTT